MNFISAISGFGYLPASGHFFKGLSDWACLAPLNLEGSNGEEVMANIILDNKVLKLFMKILIEQVLLTGVWNSHPAAHTALATTLSQDSGKGLVSARVSES